MNKGSCPQDVSSTYAKIRKTTSSNVQLVAMMSSVKERCNLARECASRLWLDLCQTGVRRSMKHMRLRGDRARQSWDSCNSWRPWDTTEKLSEENNISDLHFGNHILATLWSRGKVMWNEAWKLREEFVSCTC